MHHAFIKKNNQRSERSPIDDYEFQTIGTKSAGNYQSSPIVRDIFVPHSGK